VKKGQNYARNDTTKQKQITFVQVCLDLTDGLEDSGLWIGLLVIRCRRRKAYSASKQVTLCLDTNTQCLLKLSKRTVHTRWCLRRKESASFLWGNRNQRKNSPPCAKSPAHRCCLVRQSCWRSSSQRRYAKKGKVEWKPKTNWQIFVN
jgi:hypothetical protein